MKVSGTRQEAEPFIEHSITITFQSEKEAYAVFSIFNHTAVADVARPNGVSCVAIRDTIRDGASYDFQDCPIHAELDKSLRKWGIK